ncbi:MAG: nitroreductase family protein, partial [Acidimicrobiales bacterium]
GSESLGGSELVGDRGAGYAALTAARMAPAPDGRPPSAGQLDAILRAATTVPDHGGLRPWRFVVVSGAARERFGAALVSGLVEQRGDGVPDAAVAKMRAKALAAPCAVVLVAVVDPGSTVAEWEQVASAACTGYAVVLAASSLGLGAVWKSASVLSTRAVREIFGLGANERLLGWVNLGDPGRPRRRSSAPAALDAHVSFLSVATPGAPLATDRTGD